MAGRFQEPDHTRGDANSIGGYARVHDRPAAFEGPDGASYSVSLEVEATGEADRPFAAFLLFLRWRRLGGQGVEGHLETPYLAWGPTREAALEALGAWPLAAVKDALDRQVASAGGSTRRWWDAMRDDTT